MANDQPNDEGVSSLRWFNHLSLAHLVLAFVALAAAAGWAASFVGLHDFGAVKMIGFTPTTAWLIPAAFDGSAFACAVLTYRASIRGRAAARGRLLTWAFTALSSWINLIHQLDPQARMVAVWLPIAAVAVFDVVLSEMRNDFEERHGRKAFRMRPMLLALRWVADRADTKAGVQTQITDIPVAHLVGLGAELREVEAPQPEIVDVEPVEEPEPARWAVEPMPDNVVALTEERPEWLPEGVTAKAAMFMYLDRNPAASGRDLDVFGMRHLGTKADYGRGVRREWVAAREATANEG